MFDNALKFLLFQLIPPIAILLLVIAGAMFLTSAGNPGTIILAKNIMTSVVLGLILIFIGWLVINFFFDLIGVADWTGLQGGWFQIKCPIKI